MMVYGGGGGFLPSMILLLVYWHASLASCRIFLVFHTSLYMHTYIHIMLPQYELQFADTHFESNILNDRLVFILILWRNQRESCPLFSQFAFFPFLQGKYYLFTYKCFSRVSKVKPLLPIQVQYSNRTWFFMT